MTKLVLYKIFFFFSFLCIAVISRAQTDSIYNDSTRKMIPVDSLPKVAQPISDSAKIDSVLKKHSPKKAAIRSAILPGLGQIYNKKYWKLPIVYGALGVSGAVFIFNVTTYKDLRFAYKAKFDASPTPSNPNPDSTNYWKMKPVLRNYDINGLRSLRDEVRRNIDYSALFFLLIWGLNVVDATVDAHLKSFDVSPDLSFRVKFGRSQLAGTSGVSMVFAIK